jgi:hypothetical protein
VPRRFWAPALAVLAALSALAGADGFAHGVLLVAVVAAAVAVLDAVSERVVHRSAVVEVVLAVIGLTFIVGGAALRAPLLGLGVLLATGLGSFSQALGAPYRGREPAASRARSISGWTAKNEPTVTTRQPATEA